MLLATARSRQRFAALARGAGAGAGLAEGRAGSRRSTGAGVGWSPRARPVAWPRPACWSSTLRGGGRGRAFSSSAAFLEAAPHATGPVEESPPPPSSCSVYLPRVCVEYHNKNCCPRKRLADAGRRLGI